MSTSGVGEVTVTVQADPIVLVEEVVCVEVFPSGDAPVVITIEEEGIDIVLEAGGAMLALIDEDPVDLVFAETEVICVDIELGPPGPQGLPGVGIPLADLKHYQDLDGTKNGVNTIFTLPGGDIALLPTLLVYVNGQQIDPPSCWAASESGGVGTGYDTITFTFPLVSTDEAWASYIIDTL